MAEKEKLHMCLTAVWWGVLFAAAMGLMLVTANRKTIVIADGSYEQGSAGTAAEEAAHVKEIELLGTEEGTGVFLIPLEKNTKAENVVVENSYMKSELHIFIRKAGEEFYEEHSVQGDVAAIRRADREKRGNGVYLNLHMDAVYEYRTSMDGEYLRIEACDPHEMYRLLVVVDALESGTGKSEPGQDGPEAARDALRAELTRSVCRLLPGQLNHEAIRLYFTDVEDTSYSVEERVAFADAVQADLFLCVGVADDEDSTQYGICGWYNEDYFIPEFGNVEFADIVTRNVTVACGNRAIGLKSAAGDSILQKLSIPAAGVELGNLNNEKESALLFQESYREKLAQGIAEAIREVYTKYYEK